MHFCTSVSSVKLHSVGRVEQESHIDCCLSNMSQRGLHSLHDIIKLGFRETCCECGDSIALHDDLVQREAFAMTMMNLLETLKARYSCCDGILGEWR
jgi:hypothetical protein